MPADCSRKTKGPALPSMIGTSPALTSTSALSMPRPARADNKCSTVEIFTSPLCSVVPIMVSPTFCGVRLDVDGVGQIGAPEHNARVRRQPAAAS